METPLKVIQEILRSMLATVPWPVNLVPMPQSVVRRSRKKNPSCVGSGFVALDLIFEGEGQQEPSFTFAGGSCGNVLTILSYLGWDSIPVIRLKNDDEAQRLVADLERWKVDTRFISTEPEGSTPVVVQRILTSINGDPYHRFEWKCPSTGLWLPRYRPLPQRIALEVSTKLPDPAVFYFDRVTKSSLLLARRASESGALVFFEPSSAGDEKLFRECVEVAHVLKYSSERFPKPPPLSPKGQLKLEIQTLGEKGLRYSVNSSGAKRSWQSLPAIRVSEFKDSVGAGDWCTAGILEITAREGLGGFEKLDTEALRRALRYGQALAALNCQHAGARGLMYKISRRQLSRRVEALLRDSMPDSRPGFKGEA